MAKFKYRMQNILDIKMKLESQAKIAYGNANLRYLQEQEKLQEIVLRKTRYDKRLKELMQGNLNVLDIKHARDDVNNIKVLMRRQMVEVHKAELALEDARKALNQVMQERKGQEKLREKAFDEFKKEIATSESKEIDELVSYTYNAK